MNNLGRFIAEHRMARNLSLRKLAEIANLSHTEICRIENGTRKHPSPLALKSIAAALGANFTEIMEAAGYINDSSSSPLGSSLNTDGLTDQEVEEVRDFINFLRNKRLK
ncbi:MAG: helix-turn-helix domain-containing protein [Bacteroidota bacterium]